MGRRSTTRRGPLPRPTVRADDATLTRFAGILPFVHFCNDLGLPGLGQAPVTILDFDSTVVVSSGEQEGAQFGYSGKGRNRRRHHPLVASVADRWRFYDPLGFSSA